MEEEYVTIIEASRRVGMSDKTVRRAIHDGKLEARYPQPNKAEVSITDLLSWHATLSIRGSEVQDKLQALEARYTELFNLWQKTNAAIDTSGQPQTAVDMPEDLAVKVKALEDEVTELKARVEQLESKKQVQQPPAELKLPDGHTWLSDFADQHNIARNEARHLYDIHAIHGQPISKSARSYKHIAIGPKGRRDFWVQLHTCDDFRACDNCPHEESGQSI